MWASTIPGIELATTMEFPYSDVSGTQVTRKNARRFGEDLANALQKYLKTLEF